MVESGALTTWLLIRLFKSRFEFCSRPWTQDGKTALEMAEEKDLRDIVGLITLVRSVDFKFSSETQHKPNHYY